jgi:hypothetical protein
MHEYGHTIDSQAWGPLYLPVIGLTSGISQALSKEISKWNGHYVMNFQQLTTHDVYWTELRANKRAAKYFKKHYDINWSDPKYPLENPFE